MSDETAAEADVSSLMGGVEQVADGLVAGLYLRVAALKSVPAEVDSLQASFAASGTSFTMLLLQVVLVGAVVLGTFALVDRWLKRMPAWGGAWRRFLALVIAAVLAVVIGFIMARLLGRAGLPLRTLRLWAVVAVVGPIILAVLRTVLMASRRTDFPERSVHLVALVRDLSLAFGGAIVGVTLLATLRLWNIGPGWAICYEQVLPSRSTCCLRGWYGDTDAQWRPPLPGRDREPVGGPALRKRGRQS